MNPEDLKDIVCTCGNPEYIQTFTFKIVPAVLSPNGKEQVMPIPTRFVCTNCGKDVYDTFMEQNEESKIIL